MADKKEVRQLKKTHIRDYATEAFRFYAKAGGAQRYREALWQAGLQPQQKGIRVRGSGVPRPCEAAILRAERTVEEAGAALADLEAVERTLSYLRAQKNGAAVLKAIEIVYLAEPGKKLLRGEMTARVRQAERRIPASEKTIYRWLEGARMKFARERGLRL